MSSKTENVSEQQLAQPAPIKDPDTQEKSKKKRGAGAKKRSSHQYNRAANVKTATAAREAVMRRLGVFNEDAAELEKSLMGMMVTTQRRAIPLPVATRGVGFTAVAEYSRLTSAWNVEIVEAICTIYQYYRVSLFLLTYKVFLSRYCQHKEESFPLSPRSIMDEEYRQVLQTVNQVPISMYNIICTVGVVEAETDFNAYLPDQDLISGQDVALYLTPFNIREAIVMLSQEATPAVHRNEFFACNPLPAARWTNEPGVGPLLQNADLIWPDDYDINTLTNDVHAYSNLLTRAGNRLPKSFLVNFEWNGFGSKTLATCMYTVPSRLDARFVRRAQAVTRKKTRTVDGTERNVDVPNDEYVYRGDSHILSAHVAECWSVDGTASPIEMTTGAASYTGEVNRIQSRLQIQGRLFAHISPGNVLYKMVDAPRT